MKKAVIIKTPKIKIYKNIKFDYKTLIFFTFTLCGLIIGAFIAKEMDSELFNLIKGYLINNFEIRTQNSVFTVFCSIFCVTLIIILCNYILGLCAVGQFFSIITPFLFGIYCGFLSTIYFLINNLNGILYVASINLPFYAITAASLIKCCCESYNTSIEIFKFAQSGKTTNKPILKEYTLKFSIFLIPVCIGAFISALLFKWLNHLFTFS